MNLDVDTLTKNLASYSSEANGVSESIAKGLFPIGFAILTIFFLIELMNWKNFLNRHEKKITMSLWVEFTVKYFLGVVLLMGSSLILDSIMEVSIAIIRKVNEIYPPSSYSFSYTEADFGGWFTNMIMNFVGWILEKISQIIVIILIFIRYIDLYFLKAVAPVLIGFFYSDDFRSVVANFFKTFIAYSLLGVILLILTVIFGIVIKDDYLKGVANGDSSWTAFLVIIKGIAYIIIMVGSARKIKSLMGVS